MRLSVAAIVLAGCAPPEAPATTARAPSHTEASSVAGSAASDAVPAPTSPASAAPAGATDAVTTSLDVPGYLPAVIVVPPQSSKPAPLLLVTHGAGDRPEPDCARYEELTKKTAFVVCLRGRAMNALVPLEERRYYYDGHIELGKEVVSAIHSVGAAYGDRVDVTGITFAGYSQGAAMGILYLERGGARDTHVRRVLLVEGGSGEFSAAIAETLKEDGVDRVAMVCGQESCHERADRSVRWMKKAGLAVSSTFAPGAGHTSGGAVHPLVDEAWSWLVDGDVRFAAR
jgi:hypothetical protein